MPAIESKWWDVSWNPIRYLDGWMCTKTSPGCANCYAEKINLRFGNRIAYQNLLDFKGFRLDRKILNQPFRWRSPRRIFVMDMGDLFHEQIPFAWITEVFDVICSWRWPSKAAEREGDESLLVDPGHTYLVLTKRPQRVQDWLNWMGELWPGDSPVNVVLEVTGKFSPCAQFGVTVENEKYLWRLESLIDDVPAAHKFASFEPLLEEIRAEDYLKYLKWVVVGPETGPKRRPCEIAWLESVVDQCDAAKRPVFVKAVPINGRISHNPAEWPEKLRRRELVSGNDS